MILLSEFIQSLQELAKLGDRPITAGQMHTPEGTVFTVFVHGQILDPTEQLKT